MEKLFWSLIVAVLAACGGFCLGWATSPPEIRYINRLVSLDTLAIPVPCDSLMCSIHNFIVEFDSTRLVAEK